MQESNGSFSHVISARTFLPRQERRGKRNCLSGFKAGPGGFMDCCGTISGKVHQLSVAAAIY